MNYRGKLSKMSRNQSGQSLIETIVAIFILTSALTAGLGLTIYAFSSTTTSQNQIIASNLAREGIEVVRMMRDSNWLASDVSGDPTFNLQSCADISGRLCYPKTYSGPAYAIPTGNFRMTFDTTTNAWFTDASANYDLYFTSGNGTYSWTPNSSIPIFARMINVTLNSAAPYTNQNSNQQMIVKSVVAWRGKNCPDFLTSQDLLTLASHCKVIVEEHMTNWKDYK